MLLLGGYNCSPFKNGNAFINKSPINKISTIICNTIIITSQENIAQLHTSIKNNYIIGVSGDQQILADLAEGVVRVRLSSTRSTDRV